MPENPNKLAKFWQELKRRKVIRRNMVYLATGFVILEFVSIIAQPFGLPDWTLKFVFIILCLGFVISIILSWFYDFTPDGLERLKSIKEAKEVTTEKPSRLIAWKIATYLSVLIIVGLVLFHILGNREKSENIVTTDKSIAVLPFTYLSDEPDKQYLADGTMDEILLNLSKIEDLRVMSKTSVEQYRNTNKTITEICDELDVSFLLEGSFQKSGNQVRLIVQLIEPGKEEHAWAKKYDRNWQDIFTVQSEVAKLVAKELQAVITPKEKQLIEQIPTANLTAYDFYQRGENEHLKYQLDNDNKEALERAEDLYYKALEYDSTFAQAYSGLAWVYLDKHYWETFLTENFLDSMLILANIALAYNDQLSDAYIVKGSYYYEMGHREQAITAFDKALKFNPNSWMAYSSIGRLYIDYDLVKAIDNLQKAISLNHGSELPNLFTSIAQAYECAGFMEKAKYYSQEALLLDGDSVAYYRGLAYMEFNFGNFEKAGELIEKVYAMDSTNIVYLSNLGVKYMYLGDFEESLYYFKEYVDKLKMTGEITINHLAKIGYVYWQNGFQDEAEYYFDEQINYCNKMIELGRMYAESLITYYDLATVYALKGEKDKAYENLRIFNQRQIMPNWAVTLFNNDPLLDNIRDEPEFQLIARDVDAKYQAEHERVRKWLEENNML